MIKRCVYHWVGLWPSEGAPQEGRGVPVVRKSLGEGSEVSEKFIVSCVKRFEKKNEVFHG